MAGITQERCLELIEAIATEVLSSSQPSYYFFEFKLTNSEVGSELLKLNRRDQAILTVAMLEWCRDPKHLQQYPQLYEPKTIRLGFYGVLSAMLQLMNRQLPYEYEEIVGFIGYLTLDDLEGWNWQHRRDSLGRLVKIIENYLKSNEAIPQLLEQVQVAIAYIQKNSWCDRKLGARLQSLIPTDSKPLPMQAGEAWSDSAIAEINSLPNDLRSQWVELLLSCAAATGSKPSAKWLKATHPLVAKLGWDIFVPTLIRWFPLVEKPRTQPQGHGNQILDHDYLLSDVNADVLKGLVWLCAEQDHDDLARELMKLAITSYRKLRWIGARCVRLGNACVWALGEMPGQTGIAQLALLKVKVKLGSAQQGIEKALTAAAERVGLSRSEIEELSVPTYGLESVGVRQDTLGDFVAELVVTGTSSTELRWQKMDGKPQKSVPAAVKTDYAEDLKELKQAAKDIQTMLPAQRDRIESLYLQQKTWDLATWKARYLDHPLVGTLARRLIWQFQEDQHCSEGIWLNHQLVNRDDQPLDWICDRTQVQLWHPISSTPATILAWRNWLMAHEIQQPFKQAHREVYLLTPAEENTHTYSNRFAAHILKQHQFNALCSHRGWKNQLRLMVDDSFSPPTRWLPNWGLRAEFWVEGIGDQYGVDTNDTGTYLYLATDQVRFYPLEAAENFAYGGGGGYSRHQMHGALLDPIPLENIPALVFTEVMRDVDLFVGVASVGNDPNWADGGTQGRHYAYWQSYSFGDLSETAKTRRQVLETLIPRLKIRDRCQFHDKFLVVRGDLRTYKIHLGSGNILMEPNDQYLCIVPSQGASGSPSQVFLPFEGDKMMAIVLSKALMLAADTKITDSSILAQLQG